MFANLFKKMLGRSPEPSDYLVAQLSVRAQPMHRGEFFEDPLDELLKKENLGEVCGGGTLQHASGEIEYCDIEIKLGSKSPTAATRIIEILQGLGAPKGSKLHIEREGREVNFGVMEGLAIYLNGTELPDEIYSSCDSNFVYRELDRLVAPDGRVLSFWQGSTETAFYLYGKSFVDMKRAIEELVFTYPLCQKARIQQIA